MELREAIVEELHRRASSNKLFWTRTVEATERLLNAIREALATGSLNNRVKEALWTAVAEEIRHRIASGNKFFMKDEGVAAMVGGSPTTALVPPKEAGDLAAGDFKLELEEVECQNLAEVKELGMIDDIGEGG